MNEEIPFIAVGNDELGEPVGLKAPCPHCGKSKEVKYGTDKDGNESKILGFVNCDKSSYLVAVQGKSLTN